MTPTARSLKLLRDDGWLCDVVEKTIRAPGMVFKRDLWNIIDILCVRDDVTMGVQTTSASNFASRLQKVCDSEHMPTLRKANWKIEIHGWGKRKGRWVCRREDVS